MSTPNSLPPRSISRYVIMYMYTCTYIQCMYMYLQCTLFEGAPQGSTEIPLFLLCMEYWKCACINVVQKCEGCDIILYRRPTQTSTVGSSSSYTAPSVTQTTAEKVTPHIHVCTCTYTITVCTCAMHVPLTIHAVLLPPIYMYIFQTTCVWFFTGSTITSPGQASWGQAGGPHSDSLRQHWHHCRQPSTDTGRHAGWILSEEYCEWLLTCILNLDKHSVLVLWDKCTLLGMEYVCTAH